MFLNTLLILLWKHYIVRRRRFINTAIEFLIPLPIFILVKYLGYMHPAVYMSLLVTFESLMSRLLEERTSGVQELIKMVGVTTKTLGLAHFINVLPGSLIFSVFGTIIATAGSKSYFHHSSGFLIWLFLFLHYVSIVALAFVSSYILNGTQNSSFLAIFIYIAVSVSSVLLNTLDIPSELVPLDGLIPFVPGHWFCDELRALEFEGHKGVTSETMMSSQKARTGSVMMAFVFLLLQIIIFFGLTWYLSLTRPGKHGTALPWNFLFQKEYWTKEKVETHKEVDTENLEETPTEAKYFESLPNEHEVGIKIDHVTKVFDDFHALKNMSLPVLKGEITVLLGHNGAGKTTLMSIITGMMSATRGKVYVNGLDTVLQQSEVRRQLGFCPQHNLFFAELTVLQHVILYYLLKGTKPWDRAIRKSRKLLRNLGLEEKAESLSGQLSGGMKRRLQLACALAGDSSVLVLDEPTSGLDVETRRSLWDLLLTLRTGRTVLLSTHFMEEADALGDRVAALHSGTLRCYATPMHLKKEIDTGYRLSITLSPDVSQSDAEQQVTQIVESILPETTKLSESGVQSLAYKLPSKQSEKFPKLFKMLEDGKETMGIESIGVGVSTLEEVFLKLCSDVKAIQPEDEVDATLLDTGVTHRVTGVHRIVRHFIALFIRQLLYLKSSWISFVIMQVLLPILVVIGITYANNNGSPSGYHQDHNIIYPKRTFNLNLWSVFVGVIIQTSLISAVVLPCKERVSSTRHIHTMTGCSPELYWLTSLVYYNAYSMLVLIIPTVVVAAAVDTDHTLTQSAMLGTLVLLLFVGSLAFIAMTFLFSFMFSKHKSAASTIIGLVFIFGVIMSIFTFETELVCDKFNLEDAKTLCDYLPLMKMSAYTITPHTFVQAMMRLTKVAQLNAYCTLNKAGCPNIDPLKTNFMFDPTGFDIKKCCELNLKTPHCYLCYDEDYSPAPFLLALLFQFLVYMVLVFLAERGIISELYQRVLNSKYVAESHLSDEVLEEEQKYVKKALRRPKGDALLVSSVHKRYPTLICGESKTAVSGTSFAIHEGECFGLVGVNGAGKSTTFKMMTCETLPTSGKIVANGQHQRLIDNTEFLNGLGYCPQFFGLDDFLTGRQNLELLLIMDGLTLECAKKEAVKWLELIDLMKYADKPLSTYSGGCSRRLCSVAALARRAALSLLDEPTAGVDVAARRQLWRAVRAAQAQTTRQGRKRAVLITSHSMDEMEALCARVAIMSAGRLATLGSPAALRADHAAGLAVCIKIKDTSATTPHADGNVMNSTLTTESSDLQLLKQACLDFQWTLKYEYKTMLNYHVGKELRMKYSELFTKLEELRQRFARLIEDYAVTETTLEQVFLSYAKSSGLDTDV